MEKSAGNRYLFIELFIMIYSRPEELQKRGHFNTNGYFNRSRMSSLFFRAVSNAMS
jgi:hypothetical protein